MAKRIGFILLASVLTACADAPSAPSTAVDAGILAPLLNANVTQSPGDYIVVFNNNVTDERIESDNLLRPHGGSARFVYTRAIKGFAANLSPRALDEIRRSPNVDFVEGDGVVSADINQTPATWGLDRIDQRNLPLNNTYSYTATGAGVIAYIIDTGIHISHNEFGGRASYGFDAVDGSLPAADCDGHGTHVAGTVGGTTYGVAKGVSLVAVRVLDCTGSGTTSGVIAGVDWVTNNHPGGTPAVANMSLGGGISTALDQAVRNSITSGVTYSLSAGNNNGANACNNSPARTIEAITVGATTITDARASFSNIGTCLDLFAPGNNITSAWNTSNTATNTISGTSMSAPHVTGAAALYLQGNPTSAPLAVRNAIVNAATNGVVTNAGTGSPNKLLYTVFGGSASVVAHVEDLTGVGLLVNNPARWHAHVTVTVRDATGALVNGATVSGNWPSLSWSSSCVTNAAGTCVVKSRSDFIATFPTMTFVVGNITGPNITYDAAANKKTSITVNAPGTQPPQTVAHIHDLTGIGVLVATPTRWHAHVTVTVRDPNGAPVNGATVAGTWGSLNWSSSCVTGAAGTCVTKSRSDFLTAFPTMTFTVGSISGPNITYNAAANVKTSVTVNSP